MNAQDELERFGRDLKYYNEHYEELLARHAERWVGIYNQRVVATAKDIDSLIDLLKEKGFAPGWVFCEYLTNVRREWILSASPSP